MLLILLSTICANVVVSVVNSAFDAGNSASFNLTSFASLNRTSTSAFNVSNIEIASFFASFALTTS
jgi:hypothetical protein